AEPVALLGLLDRPRRVLHLALGGVAEQPLVAWQVRRGEAAQVLGARVEAGRRRQCPGVDGRHAAARHTEDLARVARHASVETEGLGNVTFEHANAQVHRFPQQRFDLAISRFGTMFFDDPVAAFANMTRALRPAGRLVMMVWQPHDRNEWDIAIRQSLAGPEG